MLVLRQSTSIDVRLGPFVDATDGVTPETGVTIAGADQAEVLKANGAATVAMTGALAAVTGADGWYDYTAQAGDVDTVGEVVFVLQDASLCLPVFVRGYVVEEAVYDALYAASAAGPLQSTTAGRTLDVSAGGAAGVDWANVEGQATSVNLSATTTNLVNTTTTNTDMRGTDSALLASSAPANFGDLAITATTGLVSVGTLGAGVITAGSIAASALNGKGDWNIGKAGYSLSSAGVDAILTTQMTESYAADGVAPTLAQGMFLVQQSLHEFAISGTTRTVKKLDGTTTAATFTLDDATNPTSTTRAT